MGPIFIGGLSQGKASSFAEQQNTGTSQPEISSKLTSLNVSVDELQLAINDMYERLQPVLRPEGPKDPTNCNQIPLLTHTKIGSEIQSIDDRISSLTMAVRSMTSSLEI